MQYRQFYLQFLLISVFERTFAQNTSTNSHSSSKEEEDDDAQVTFKRIPGCPDIESFQRANSFESLNSGQLSRIACLCGPAGHVEDEEPANEQQNDEMASITCIYGSTLADVEHTIGLAKQANKDIERIALNHVEFGDGKSILDILLEANASQLRHLEIRKCRGNALNLSHYEGDSVSKFGALEAVIIEDCEMGQMPAGLLTRAPHMKSISLANNKIQQIARMDLAGSKQTLENLNLAGNLLSSGIEDGSLSQLEMLKSLEIGEHNFASRELLLEIGQLASLESLDMSQIDGIESTVQFASFTTMENMKRLILTGCNLKVLGKGSFEIFPSLEWLDLRINLIERLESGCFAGLRNLRFLSLAGNFLKELPAQVWQDLPMLEDVDLGWNDFRALNKSSFDGMGSKFERLNLRNNEVLKQIETGTFDGLTELLYLNLSKTSIGRVRNGLLNLPKLQELDLSGSNISFIEAAAFEAFKHSLILLNLDGNYLRELDENLLVGMNSLRTLDLSENHWLCDAKMQKIAVQLDEAYKRAAAEKKEFELRHSTAAICDRPFSRRGQSIFELIGEEASELAYKEWADTTTPGPPTTTTKPDGLLLGGDENVTVDWKAISLLVGSEGNEHLNLTALLDENAKEDAKKPRYDINVVKYGHKSVTKREANTWLSGVIVTLLVIVTAFCIIIVARRNKSGNEEVVKDEKMEDGAKKCEELNASIMETDSHSSPTEQQQTQLKREQSQQKQEQHSQQQPQQRTFGTDTDLERNCATTSF